MNKSIQNFRKEEVKAIYRLLNNTYDEHENKLTEFEAVQLIEKITFYLKKERNAT